MGLLLSFPLTKKTSFSGANGQLFYSLSEMQGWREEMEDAHAAVLDLDGANDKSNCFFAVYDGHSGSVMAEFAGKNVHKRLVTEESYCKGDHETALKKAFLGTDEDFVLDHNYKGDKSGCTAIAALITKDNKIYVANAGDSRSVIGIKGDAKPLSFDHKPANDTERSRITAAGGYVSQLDDPDGRVNGELAPSRAFGDFQFKKNLELGPEDQMVTSNPDVTCHEITEDDEFLILACDGIWDCLESQDVVDFVRYKVHEGKELTEICEMLFDHCLSPDASGGRIGCDNMSLIIIAITHGRTQKQWYEWIRNQVRSGIGRETRSTPPRLYSEHRLESFRARKEYREHYDIAVSQKTDSKAPV